MNTAPTSFAGRFVIGAEHRTTRMFGRCRQRRVADHHERLRHEQADARRASLTGLRNREPAQCGMVTHVVRRVAVRVCQTISPRSTLIADTVPYGGLRIEMPSMARPLAFDAVAGGGGGAALAFC